MTLSDAELALIDRWQRDFPLAARPFAVVGEAAGIGEHAAIATFETLQARGVISRIGAVVKPNTLGASTLAAMCVPADRLTAVANVVSAEPFVNHNYAREHPFNLWFVVAGPDSISIVDAVASIEQKTGLAVRSLPLAKAYHLDLGFSLTAPRSRQRTQAREITYQADRRDRELLGAIENGLPLVERPYQSVGVGIGATEAHVIGRIGHLEEAGVISRFGCVVRHRSMGYAANAMVVWDVPDDVVDHVASRFIDNANVTLCYQRPRVLPDWPFNLFCMVHGKTRAASRAVIDDLNATADARCFPQAVLFSTHCFKQRGAVFSERRRGLHS
jgi:DNA-binding Lrp family transcriptional regulator